MKHRHNPSMNKLSLYMAIWGILMALVFYSCNDALEPNEPGFTEYTGPEISDYAGNWDLLNTVAIGQTTGLTDTVRVGDLVQLSPDSINLNGVFYLAYSVVGEQVMAITAAGRYNYSVISGVVLVRPGDTLVAGQQQVTETGLLDVYNEKMIIVSDSADSNQGSLLTGPLDYAIINYSASLDSLVIVGQTPFFQFSDGSTQAAQVFTTFLKR